MLAILTLAALASRALSDCAYSNLPSAVTSVCAQDLAQCQGSTNGCKLDRLTCSNATNNGTCNALGSYVDWRTTSGSFGNCSDPIDFPIYIQDVAFAPEFSSLTFNCYKLVIPRTMKWANNLTYLYIYSGGLTSVPPVPPTVQYLSFWGNLLSTSSELAMIPKSTIFLDVGKNQFSELTHLDWSNLTFAYDTYSRLLYIIEPRSRVYFNNALRRMENISFGKNILTLDLTNITLTSWIMSNDTFKILDNKLLPEHPQSDSRYQGNLSTAGYLCNFTSITSDPIECDAKGGMIQELWASSRLNRFYANQNSNFTVCVLRDLVTPVTNVPTTPAPTTSSLSTGATIGIAAGAAFLIGLAFFVVILRRQRQAKEAQTLYDLNNTPTLSQGEEAGLNMQELTLCRLDHTALKLQKKIGSGAFADVWLGTFDGEAVAVKKMHANRVTITQLQSFVEEIKLMRTFDSPYIVKLVGAVWTRPSDVKCVMELMDSGDLKDYLDKHSAMDFKWNDKYLNIHSIVQALAYLHSLNIVHRDLKSRNVLLDTKKGTKLTDFGISKEDMQATMTMGVGTFRWMAPEVIQDKAYGVSADIYSFGMLLSEFDTHHIPYENLKNQANGQPLSDSAIMVKVVGGTIKPTFTPNCPSWVLNMAMQCLAYNPEDRPTAMELSHLIRTELRNLAPNLFSM
ncbi:Aste57867_11480 [Aphanomyces stellatus]|uniref:Aste57867_11480 protein n=1 Tax=Aphanomyces stellatus TaxID=120398 RepID=A0A485KT59_9STRA|nr:hypothetical protein As57867_011437 [Aphanomyces stellatus]VFT88341.1 Aste57867_11480 [Aphanomyces stellatus]